MSNRSTDVRATTTSRYVPYRNSLLTMVLKDSLGKIFIYTIVLSSFILKASSTYRLKIKLLKLGLRNIHEIFVLECAILQSINLKQLIYKISWKPNKILLFIFLQSLSDIKGLFIKTLLKLFL